jgi:hypothetical protein
MPDGSGRKVIAAQAGGAFAGVLAATAASPAIKTSAKPNPNVIVLLIAWFPASRSGKGFILAKSAPK